MNFKITYTNTKTGAKLITFVHCLDEKMANTVAPLMYGEHWLVFDVQLILEV